MDQMDARPPTLMRADYHPSWLVSNDRLTALEWTTMLWYGRRVLRAYADAAP